LTVALPRGRGDPLARPAHTLVRTAPLADLPSPAALEETSILLVAQHALVRAGLRSVLGTTPGLVVRAEAVRLQDALALADRHRPDVVLLDSAPASEADVAAVDALRRAVPGACVLYLGDESTLGARGLPCVPPDAGVSELCTTIGALLGGRCAACRLRSQCPAPRLAAALSRRERQVAVHVAAGLSSKQIAATLGVSLRTVNTYRESLAKKIGASSGAVLTRYVLEHGLDQGLGVDRRTTG
jgi:DNA-binding NarL/FixJ family response regulator